MADKHKQPSNARVGAAAPTGQSRHAQGQHGATQVGKKLYGLDATHPEMVGPTPGDARRQSHKSRGGSSQIDSRSHQAPSNNQSGAIPNLGDSTEPGQAEGLAPFLNIDFKLTNEATQFNCFMNSIVQAMWHCKSANEALQEVKDLGQEAMAIGGKRGDVRSCKEYQLVTHLQALFDEATQSHAALQESLRIHQQAEIDSQSTAAASSQSSQKGSKASKSQSKQQVPPVQQELLQAQDPLLSPDLLRRELFKLYYATQNPEKFDLYKKADASEFLQSLLEMIHFCLNRNHKKENIDSFCGQLGSGSDHLAERSRPCPQTSCLVHQKMFQNVFVVKSCPCSPEKQPVQEYHQNNFMYIVNAQEVIDMQLQMLKGLKKSGRKYRRCELEVTANKLIQCCRAINDRTESRCEMGGGSADVQPSEGGVKQAVTSKSTGQSGAKCKFQQTQYTNCIRAPFPEILSLNVNWFDNQVAYMDTLRFCAAIPQRLRLDELFKVVGGEAAGQDRADQVDVSKDEYVLRSVVCFLGAHYMTYVKQVGATHHKDGSVEYEPVWKLYDDYKSVTKYQCWKDILEKILEFGTLPTVLIYERVPHQSPWAHAFDAYDKMNVDELYQLYKRAQSFQQFYDQIEAIQAQNEIKQKKEQEKKKPAASTSKGGVVPDPQQPSVAQPKKSEADILKELYLVKQKYKPYNIYIFECIGCSLFMMLHQKVCPHCGRSNAYYDGDLQIGKQIEEDVAGVLEGFHQQLGMTNQAAGATGASASDFGILSPKAADVQEAGMQGAVTTQNFEESEDEQPRPGGRPGEEDVVEQDAGAGANQAEMSGDRAGRMERGGNALKSLKSKRGAKNDQAQGQGSAPASSQRPHRAEDDRTTNRDSQDSNRTQDIDQDRKEAEAEPPVPQPEAKTLTVWRCPKCSMYNIFGESQQCMNKAAKCPFDLGYLEDPSECLVQMDEEEYNRRTGKTREPVPQHKQQETPAQEERPKEAANEKKEEEAMKDDEWLCEQCKTKNRMTTDRASALCSKCRVKNPVVAWLIEAKADQDQAKQEVRVLNHYKQQQAKGGQELSRSGKSVNQPPGPSSRHGAGATAGGRDSRQRGHGGSDQAQNPAGPGRGDAPKNSSQGNPQQPHHQDKQKAGSRGTGGGQFVSSSSRAVPSSSAGQGRPASSSQQAQYVGKGQQAPCRRCLGPLQPSEHGLVCPRCLQQDSENEQKRKLEAEVDAQRRQRERMQQAQLAMQANEQDKRSRQQRHGQAVHAQPPQKSKIASITVDPAYAEQSVPSNAHHGAYDPRAQIRQIEEMRAAAFQKQPHQQASQAQRYQPQTRPQDAGYSRQHQQIHDQNAYYAQRQQPKSTQQYLHGQHPQQMQAHHADAAHGRYPREVAPSGQHGHHYAPSRDQYADSMKNSYHEGYQQKQRHAPPTNYPAHIQTAGYSHHQQHYVPDNDDEQYERRGDFYQCVRCEEYTVHVANDKYCRNPACPTNAKRPVDRPAMNQKPKQHVPSSTGSKNKQRGGAGASGSAGKKYCQMCRDVIKAADHAAYHGKCYQCYKRAAASRHIKR